MRGLIRQDGKREEHPVPRGAMLLVLALLPSCASADRISGVIPAEWPVGLAVPVSMPLPPSVSHADVAGVQLDIAGRAEPVTLPAQGEPAHSIAGTPARVWFMFTAGREDAGKPVTVRLAHRGAGQTGGDLRRDACYRLKYEDPMLHVTTPDGGSILSYWHGAPDGRNPKGYPLNDFIHPLIGLDGEVLTASSPPDHIHHRGIFWAWVRVDRRGEYIGDWWIPDSIHVEPGRLDRITGAIFGGFTAQHFWVHQPKNAERGERFVDEQFTCRIFETTDAGRAIDMDLTLAALDDGVRIGGQLAKDKGYSGLTIRFGPAADVKIEYDGGVITEADVNQLRARWVDWTGVFAGPAGRPLAHRSGGALLVHPTHPDSPPEWITRKYGPVNVSYPGLEMLEIPKDRPLRLRYRLWVHRKDAAAGHVDEHYRAYAADWNWRAG